MQALGEMRNQYTQMRGKNLPASNAVDRRHLAAKEVNRHSETGSSEFSTKCRQAQKDVQSREAPPTVLADNVIKVLRPLSEESHYKTLIALLLAQLLMRKGLCPFFEIVRAECAEAFPISFLRVPPPLGPADCRFRL